MMMAINDDDETLRYWVYMQVYMSYLLGYYLATAATLDVLFKTRLKNPIPYTVFVFCLNVLHTVYISGSIFGPDE